MRSSPMRRERLSAMGNSLTGTDSRIWELHMQGFAVSRISGLVGLSDGYVRSLICAVWHDDKLAAKNSRKA